MNISILRFSSITKKVIIALAGIFLLIFLLVHLGINLLILSPDNGVKFMAASEFMSSNPIIKIFEKVLFGGFALHVLMGVVLSVKNWISRPVKYYKTNKSHTSFFSKYMFHTGAIIFAFLVLHLANFWCVKEGFIPPPEGISNPHDFYSMAVKLFNNEIYSSIYIVALLFLGFHLNHAFHSAFQTLGLNHSKYMPAIKVIGATYSIFVTLGFIMIPIHFLFFL